MKFKKKLKCDKRFLTTTTTNKKKKRYHLKEPKPIRSCNLAVSTLTGVLDPNVFMSMDRATWFVRLFQMLNTQFVKKLIDRKKIHLEKIQWIILDLIDNDKTFFHFNFKTRMDQSALDAESECLPIYHRIVTLLLIVLIDQFILLKTDTNLVAHLRTVTMAFRFFFKFTCLMSFSHNSLCSNRKTNK
ncbi:hypothetical protein BpHYR1_044055 [Brachionus plicatilis]|uniref:Uncharacterized protein n=1 Tax=Brachionus plicatilis TaxID=10195 RepID=A0A3M7SE68_BRAPC|nr:hypothetical protein BpHYR1_044055 [Brachionus plicatilis]